MPSPMKLVETVLHQQLDAGFQIDTESDLARNLTSFNDYLALPIVELEASPKGFDGGMAHLMEYGMQVATCAFGQVIRQSSERRLEADTKAARLQSMVGVLGLIAACEKSWAVSMEIRHGFIFQKFERPELSLDISGPTVALHPGFTELTSFYGKDGAGCPFTQALTGLYPKLIDVMLPMYELNDLIPESSQATESAFISKLNFL